jgi:hypothetical protein
MTFSSAKYDSRRQGMSIDSSKGHPAMDYRAHNDTYAGFLRGTQVLGGFLIILLILMTVFLV